MSSRRTWVYRVATETPAGWFWQCAWCQAEAEVPAPTWDAAVDALMDVHTLVCKPYQLWVQGLTQQTQQWSHPPRPPEEAPQQLTMLSGTQNGCQHGGNRVE